MVRLVQDVVRYSDEVNDIIINLRYHCVHVPLLQCSRLIDSARKSHLNSVPDKKKICVRKLLTLYHAIPTFNDPIEERLRKHC